MQKSVRTCVAVALVLFLVPARLSFAWTDTGHKMVALIAWEDLTPKTRAAISELLKKHPRYVKDLLPGLPEGSSPADTDRYAFATAATWPDLVRSKTNPMSFTHSHPSWHFIDIPIVEEGVEPPPSTEPSTPGPKNIVEALAQVTGELKTDSTPADQKAIDICWVAHLVGDIHQPLHAATLCTKQFPAGDHGGNFDYVLRDPPYANSEIKLHLLWDELPGEYKTIQLDGYEAMGLRADPQFSREKLKSLIEVKDFMAWAKESHQFAVDVAYKVKFIVSSEFRPPKDAPGAPAEYFAKAEPVAMHQVVLAGYRLADALNSIFDAQK